jgi:hypothetical protein
MYGAGMKLFPLGVGKWSLMGDLQWAKEGSSNSSTIDAALIDPSSSSIIVLRERLRL